MAGHKGAKKPSFRKASAGKGSALAAQRPVTLRYGTETITVPFGDAQGKSISDVFRAKANALGLDFSRGGADGFTVRRDGFVEGPGAQATEGGTYVLSLARETKG